MGEIRIITVPTGRLDGRSYILLCPENSVAVVVDPDVNLDKILDILAKEDAKAEYILLTHGHFDHISSSDPLREKTGAKTAVHRLDVPALSDPNLNMSGPFGFPPITETHADIVLEDGSELAVGGVVLKTLHTPGHTPGSCCFLVGQHLFTGDTLFRDTYGTTALPGGDMGALIKSAARLFQLDGNITIYPGHGRASTIGRERSSNPICL